MAPSPATKPITPSATEPSTDLERLHRDRAGVVESIKRLTGVSTRLHAEAAAGASLIDELAKLAETETNDMRAWADGGCQGPAPKGKQAERQAIASKMTATSATAAAAGKALGDIDAQLAEHNSRLIDIAGQIEQAVFDLIEGEHGDIISEYVGICERGSELATRISGLALMFRETGNYRRAEVIFSVKLPMISTSPREVQADADAWGRRVRDLKAGV
jgi:hypothetical protein